MNKRSIILGGLILFGTLLLAQQYDTTYYDLKFVSETEGMWNSGSTDILPAMEKTYSFSWDESQKIGGVESVLGMDFGAELYGKTAGTVGIGYYMSKINGGSIDSITYPINIEFMIPKPEDISAGQTIKIASRAFVDEGQKPSIETTFPLEGKVGVNMIFDLET
ncbi:MAG: hypothetical protein PF450_06810, partial [Bacteroidales bacterium]|nr:hypothetical protein [Bacteroidales bacterium]